MDSLAFQLVTGALFVLGGVLAVALWVMPMANRSKGIVIPGILKIGKHEYPYELGDQILRYGGGDTFSGIAFTLPKRLPHIYLDAHANDREGLRPEFVYETDDKISLEGDFDSHFQAYVPKEHKALALSILSPDVMETLAGQVDQFDVEIMEYRVRLMVSEPVEILVSRNEQLQEALMTAAKPLMQEIDHRLKSWNESSLTGDTALDVRKHNENLWQQ